MLRLLARGYSNKEIAISRLEVSAQTVKWHLKQVYAKLAVGSRRQATSRARALGVIGFDASRDRARPAPVRAGAVSRPGAAVAEPGGAALDPRDRGGGKSTLVDCPSWHT